MLRFLLIAHIAVVVSMAAFIDREVPNPDLYKSGDLVIAGILSHSVQIPGQACSTQIFHQYSDHGIQITGALIYALERLTANTSILPNISLGYVLMDDCRNEAIALMKSSQLVPIKQCVKGGCGVGGTKSSHVLTSGTHSHYDVVGVVGPMSSDLQMQTSLLLSFYDIPHIGYMATADALSDKSRYKYFTRVVPPEQHQTRALVDFISHYNWTYISVIYNEGASRSTAMRYFRQGIEKLGICIAFSVELRADFTNDDYDWVVVQLKKNWKAKVVVNLVTMNLGLLLLSAMDRANATAEFVTVSSETFYPVDAYPLNPGRNWLAIRFPLRNDPSFDRYFKALSPFGTGDKSWSWSRGYNENMLGCSWEVPNNNNNSCHRFKSYNDIEGYKISSRTSSIIDATNTIGFALHHLISDTCPDAFINKALLKNCVNGPLLLKYIRNSKFKGVTTNIEFDTLGDLVGGSYDILSFSKDVKMRWIDTLVGSWQIKTGQMEIDENKVAWWKKTTNGDIVRTSEIPESVCAKPCQAGEFYLMGELPCCWQCRRCRDNEYLRSNMKGCDVCPPNTWPDQVGFNTCEPIPSSYMHFSDAIAICLTSIAGIMLLITIIITIIFIKHRERKVIKGSNRELMAPIIMGLFLAFASVYFFVAKADDWICYANYFGFNLSCTLIFGPLFLKTLRMYRIFAAAERCEIRVRGVDSTTQIVSMLIIFTTQVGVNVGMCFYRPPTAVETMPVPTAKHVELSCLLPEVNLLSPLCYNIVLLLLCAVFGFLTRKLPENFNESWYIFISVTTTLFVWIAFLPTYVMAFYAYHKSALLGFALILNGVVTILCLFSPKLYALYFVDEKSIKVTNFQFSESSQVKGSTNERTVSGLAELALNNVDTQTGVLHTI